MQLIAIIKKEFLNLIRDKKAFIALFVPLILFPLVYLIMGTQLENIETTIETEIPVYSNITDHPEERDYVTELLSGVPIKFVDTSDPKASLKSEEIYLMLEFDRDRLYELPLEVTVTYNTNSNYSSIAYTQVASALESLNIQIMAQKLAASGIDLSVMDNVRITMKSISTNTLLVMLAPMLIVSLLVSGGSSIAADTFAGEKERGTLEQLAVTQVKRSTLLLGKTIVVEAVTLINAVISLLAYYISLKIAPEVSELMGDTGESITFTFSSAVWLVLSIITFSMMVSAVLVFISLMAKSVKEAQANMAIITMLPSIVSILVMFATASNQSVCAMLIPIYNVIVSIKMIFADAVSVELLTASCISNLIYACVIYLLCALNVKSNKFLA